MALILMDSFDQHYTRADLFRNKSLMWNGNQSNQDANAGNFLSLTYDGAVGGNTIRTQANTGSFSLGLYRNFPTGVAPQTVIFGCWFQLVNTGTISTECIISLLDFTSSVTQAATGQIELRYNSSRQLQLLRNGTQLAVSTNTLTQGTWYHIELKTKIDNAAGTYEVRVNGTSVNWIPLATAQNTRGSANNRVNGYAISTYANTSTYALKSIYFLDDSGSVANDFLGVCKISVLHPTGAGNYAQNGASTGANFSATSKRWIDLDNSYVYCGAVNNKDTYKFEDAPASGGTIHAVQHTVLMRQDAASLRTLSPMSRVSGTDYVSSTQWYPASGYLYFTDPLTLNPNTSAQWTNSELAGAEFGFKVIS